MARVWEMSEREVDCLIRDEKLSQAFVEFTASSLLVGSSVELERGPLTDDDAQALSRESGLALFRSPAYRRALHALATAVRLRWPALLLGAQDAGKTALVRLLACLARRPLVHLSLNAATDALELLGSFEQVWSKC